MKVCLFSLDTKIWYCTKLNIIFWVLRIKLLVFLVLGTEFSNYAEYLVLWWNAILESTWDGFPKQDSPRKQLSTRPPPGRHPIDRQGMAQFYTNSGTGEQHRGPGTQSQLQHNHTAALLSVLGAACPEIAHKAAHTNRREPRQSGVGSPAIVAAIFKQSCNVNAFCLSVLETWFVLYSKVKGKFFHHPTPSSAALAMEILKRQRGKWIYIKPTFNMK